MQNKQNLNKETEYSLKVISRDGVAHVSVVGSGLYYSTQEQNEPDGKIFKGFHDKKRKRGRILVKLGIWENGQNSMPLRKQE